MAAHLVPQAMAYAEVAGLPAVAGLWRVVGPLTLYAASTALMTATAVSVVAAGQTHQLGQRCRRPCDGGGRDLPPRASSCLLGWVGRLGFLANLLSRPVLIGYMN